MHIAQLSVAGEEISRPKTLDATQSDTDRGALHEYACDRTNLPWIIFRAAHRANHLVALPARARAVLAALARTVDAARPYAAIFARRELLTGRAMQSMRTFYRSLEDLEAKGMITRPPQSRYGAAGLFGRAYLHLTPTAAELLGLVEETVNAISSNTNAVELAVRDEDTLSLNIPSVTVADGAIYKDLFPNHQKRQPGRLPADLERLRGLGFRHFLIFKLMREAAQQAKRLSDVVEASWKHLKRATHPISYLRALLRAPVDFAYRVRSKRAESVEAKQQTNRSIADEAAVAELAGQSFESRDGIRQFSISPDAKSITMHHRDERRPRVHTGDWAGDFLTAIRAGLIVSTSKSSDESAARVRPHPATRLETASQIGAHLDELKRLLRFKQAGIAVPSPASRFPRTTTVTNRPIVQADKPLNSYDKYVATAPRRHL